MPLSAGDRLGPYEILAQIGAGGMGEVYRARDTRLDRNVAIKISKEQYSQRFEQEARAVAALNHPHICTLYDIGPNYLVMEYIEGTPLRGPLPMEKALTYAAQICDALDAAHRRGIVHRDLKPGNILITKGGVKLLDFGIAEMKKPTATGDNTATMTIPASGQIEGTLQYIAPEQLQGKPADARSDIFAFGLVLYEMLTGRTAFQADNPANLIAAVLTSDPPPLKDLLPESPRALDRIVTTCIAKSADERWQSAGDIKRAIDLIDLAPVALAPAVTTPAKSRSLLWYAAVLAAVLGSIAIGFFLSKSREKTPEPWAFRPITYSGRAYGPVLSPDGKQVAYLWTGENTGGFDLYVQLVSGGSPLHLKDTQPKGRPAWSPDGTQIAFQRTDGLYVVSALGGTPRRIASLGNLVSTANVSWAPDGSFFIVDGRGGELKSVAAESGEVRALTKPENGSDGNPAISPDGSAVAFVHNTSLFNATLMTLPLTKQGTAAGEAKSLARTTSTIRAPTWTSDGKEILFENALGGGNASIWRVSSKGGEPARVNLPSMLASGPTTATHSGRMVYVSGYEETKLIKLPIAGSKAGPPQPIIEALGDHRDLSVSADGSHVAFVSTRTGSKEIWIANADGTNQTQLTFVNGASVGSPHWSPDGTRIAFDGYASGSSDIYVVPVDGGKPVRLTTDPGNETRPSWSSDGKWIYFAWDKGSLQIWKIPAAGGTPVQVTHSGGGQEALESPDGQWVYFSRAPNLYRIRPDGSEESQVRPNVYPSFFNVGSRNVYVLESSGGRVLRAPVGKTDFEPVFTFDDSNRPNCLGPCLGLPKDESFVIYRRVTRSMASLTLIENFR
jgi:serine/threonine protein kinase